MEVKAIDYDGAKAVELTTSALRLVAMSEYGPRIAHLSKPGGENLLLWEPEKYTRGEWDLRGGHRVWMTRPMADESEDSYRPDNAECIVEIKDDGFAVVAPVDPVTNLQRGIKIKVLTDDKLAVHSFISNKSELLFSCGVWALTCTLPTATTRYAVPVGDGSDWDSFTLVNFREWGGHGAGGFNDPQFDVTEDAFVITPNGVENKRMLQSHKGIIAMSDPDRGVAFAKKVSYCPELQYPLGCNIAAYIGPDNFMVEMETMGAEKTVKPGKTACHEEIWVLKETDHNVIRAEEIEALFE